MEVVANHPNIAYRMEFQFLKSLFMQQKSFQSCCTYS